MIEPKLGQFIRGARLGWAWSPAIGAFLRVSDAAPDRWLFDARPADTLPKRPDRNEYRVWWQEDRYARRILFGGARPGFVRRNVRFVVDENGELVGGS